MTTVDRRPTTAQDVLDATRAMAPAIAARAAEIEAARRLPRDLLDQLVGAGCIRLLRPRTHGGLGADLPAAVRVFESLARADASVAWTMMIGGGGWIDLAGLPRATFDAVLARPDAVIAGVINPSASIAPVAGGYRVTGRWSFASGCEHADWLYGNAIEDVDSGAGGVPQMRIAVLAPDEVTIEDTWNVSGLCGTGSHHFRADVVIPAERTTRPFEDPSCVDEPMVRIPPPPLLAPMIAAVAVGVAQGALDDLLALAAAKVPLLEHTTLATNPHFQFELATADTELRAARALLHESAAATWAAAAGGAPMAWEQRARARAAAVWVTERAAAVVGTAYRAGGGSSLYAGCPLQRRLRDVHAVTQHFLVKRDTLTTAGAVLAGQDVTVPVF
jgi:alkylation response protein AidB-like acyl-CoA dehydrogenase